MNWQIWVLILRSDVCNQISYRAAISHASRLACSGSYTDKSHSFCWGLSCGSLSNTMQGESETANLEGARGCSPWNQEGSWALRKLNGSKAIWRWWDTLSTGLDSPASWRVRKKTLHIYDGEREKEKKEAWRKKKKVLRCTLEAGFKGASGFWVRLQLSDEDFQLNFKSWKENEPKREKKHGSC